MEPCLHLLCKMTNQPMGYGPRNPIKVFILDLLGSWKHHQRGIKKLFS